MILKADLVIASSGPLEGGCVLIREGKIQWVGKFRELKENRDLIMDLTGCAISPGMMNCHCHLELSALRGKVDKGSSFADWIFNLLRGRRGWDRRRYRESAREGVMELIRYGTTFVADVTYSGESIGPLISSGIRGVVFYELLGLDPISARIRMGMARGWLRKAGKHSYVGLSPHAPYSVSGWLYRKAIKLAELERIPIATHVSETKEELELFLNRTGPLKRMIDMIPGSRLFWRPPRMSPMKYIMSLGYSRTKGLIIHANYLSEEEIELVAMSGCPVVYCPRSASFFGHESHPVERIMGSGGKVVLGTDSLASNRSLSMIEEIRELLRRHGSIPPRKALEMVTKDAADALGLSTKVGKLEAGMEADISAFEILDSGWKDPYLVLIEGTNPESIMTMVGGRIILLSRTGLSPL